MKIEEYARKWLQEQERGKLPDSVIDSLTNPERERDIAQGIRIGLEIAYQCWMWDFEREDEELSAVAKHLRCVFDAIKSGERDVPGVGE